MVQSRGLGAVLIVVAFAVGFYLARARETTQITTGQSDADHHVVYFVGEPSSGALSPSAIQAQLALMPDFLYTEVAEWSEVLDAQETNDIDVLIVDSGSLTNSDAAWVADKYWTGAAILGIGVSLDDIGSLVSNTMITGTVTAELMHQEHYSGAYTSNFGPPILLTAIREDPAGARGGYADLASAESGGGEFHTLHVGTEVDGVGPFYSLMIQSAAEDEP